MSDDFFVWEQGQVNDRVDRDRELRDRLAAQRRDLGGGEPKARLLAPLAAGLAGLSRRRRERRHARALAALDRRRSRPGEDSQR